ncbi:MAG TPA: hypothetical protein VJR89_37725, partial [Polyangiales bacterium]|nr:hypothetical protein [Polyangiales bacterium]
MSKQFHALRILTFAWPAQAPFHSVFGGAHDGILDFAQALCSGVTGSRCSMPRLSSWYLVNPGQMNIGVDVLDIATVGVSAVVPANLKACGSYFTTGLVRRSASGGMSAYLSGYGGGAGVGAGWSLSITGSVMGNSTGIKREVIQKLGDSAQGSIL